MLIDESIAKFREHRNSQRNFSLLIISVTQLVLSETCLAIN